MCTTSQSTFKGMTVGSQYFKHVIFMLFSLTNLHQKLVHTILDPSLAVLSALPQKPGAHFSFHLV